MPVRYFKTGKELYDFRAKSGILVRSYWLTRNNKWAAEYTKMSRGKIKLKKMI